MTLTTYLAELLGLYIALVGVVTIVKPRAMRDVLMAFVAQHPLLFLLATLRVLIGLAIVLSHNRMVGDATDDRHTDRLDHLTAWHRDVAGAR